MRTIYPQDLALWERNEAEERIRFSVQIVDIGDGLVLSRVLGHHKMFLRKDDLGFSCHVMMDGYWETWLTLFFARTIKPGMVVFDIGANLGYYTLLFSDCVGASGKVVAVEPVPGTAAILEKNIRLNGFGHIVQLVGAAVTDGASDTVRMIIPNNELKNATIVADGYDDAFSVPATTVDHLAAPLDRVDLIKIDAEGAEESIFVGMKETLRRFGPMVLLEFNAARYADPEKFLADLIEVCGPPQLLNYDGRPETVSMSSIALDQSREDKLLFFSGRHTDGA